MRRGAATTTEACYLCGQAEGGVSINLVWPLVESDWALRPVLVETEHAVVMPSLGALSVGHVLVCPKQHVRSIAAAADAVAADVADLAAQIAARLDGELGSASHIFEHGSSCNGERIACSVEHAHVHVIPCNVNVGPAVEQVAAWERTEPDIHELRDQTRGREYIRYEAPTGEAWLATGEHFESQLLRKVFAEAMGIGPEWDWRQYPQRSNIIATRALFNQLDSRNAAAA